ncbi:pentapeptide repeat-containing protein [Pseudanabaena sp. FACHB-1998]|uniref:pentapeptide repeat-containing protein n=1 Tax=Pseudanabaena sp. FACHB-1998 TaxID=2692858 RepID=UPI001F558A6B|nr:pentapeptide repeat-containing protein [Pseudanabaena sp. FACHB-1998]
MSIPNPRIKALFLIIAAIATLFASVATYLERDELVYISLAVISVVVLPILLPPVLTAIAESPLGRRWDVSISAILAGSAVLIAAHVTQFDASFARWFDSLKWEALGAVGQILIAILAVWVAWRQNQISEELTGQQNVITQQQTIDAYFQGISDLVLDPQGQLEDWPLERAIAQARTAALLGGCDADGRAKIIRFLSSANLLTPLKRDGLLGRPILDGTGGYVVDLANGVRVVNLGMMLAARDVSKTDLRNADLSGANLMKASFFNCDLTGTNFGGAILAKANLRGTDLSRVKLFYGKLETATPRDRLHLPNFETGEYTGAIVEDADFSKAIDLSEDNRKYLCAWCGKKSRKTIPGGCEDVPNRLGR